MTTTEKQLELYQKALAQVFFKNLEDNLRWQYDTKEALKAEDFAQFKKEVIKLTDFRDIIVMLHGKELLGVLNQDNQLEKFYNDHKISSENDI